MPDAQPQHLEALDRANRARRRRYAVRRCVAARTVSLCAVIRDELPPMFSELVGTVKVSEALTWGHRVGELVARRIMLEAEIPPTATLKLRDLSPARRDRLAAAVEQIAPMACEGATELDAIAELVEAAAAAPARDYAPGDTAAAA